MTDAEKIADMKKLLEDAANLMPPVHTKEMREWWERARVYVLPVGHADCTVCVNRVAENFYLKD